MYSCHSFGGAWKDCRLRIFYYLRISTSIHLSTDIKNAHVSWVDIRLGSGCGSVANSDASEVIVCGFKSNFLLINSHSSLNNEMKKWETNSCDPGVIEGLNKPRYRWTTFFLSKKRIFLPNCGLKLETPNDEGCWVHSLKKETRGRNEFWGKIRKIAATYFFSWKKQFDFCFGYN